MDGELPDLGARIAELRAKAPKRRTPKAAPDRYITVKVDGPLFERIQGKALENGFGDSITGWLMWLLEENHK